MTASRLPVLLLLFACSSPPDVSRWHPATTRQSWEPEAGDPIPVPQALAGLGWLSDISAWGHSGPPTDRAHSGSFGVGNGRVFGLIGLDEPRNTITGAIGPGYQSRGGFFGDSAVHLVQAGQLLVPEWEQAQRPRGTAIVRTLARTGALTLLTTDVAPPGVDAIVRHITVRAGSAVSEPTLVRLSLARTSDEQVPTSPDALVQVRETVQLRIECPGGSATRDALDVVVPALAEQAEWSVTCLYLFGTGGQWPQVTTDITSMLSTSRAETTSFLDRATKLDVPDAKVSDLYEGMLTTMHVQTAESGIVSPMNRYTRGWLRDEEGPIRLYLMAGLHEETRRILDAGYGASIQRHAISNSFSLDVEWDGAEPADPEAFWASASFMPGYAPAEAPSFVPLLVGRYLDHTGDASILTPSRLAFLTACLTRQELSPEGLLPFSRDETFRYPFATVLGASPETLGWSANSSFLLAAAAERLRGMGGPASLDELAARVRTAAEAHFWSDERRAYAPIVSTTGETGAEAPYEDVSTQPLWLGYLSAGEPKAQANLETTLQALLREDGTLVSPSAAFYTGMVPGFLLRNLTALARPEEERAFNALDLVASPSGHFEELHSPDNSVAMVVHRPDGLGGDASARYRPWEGGDVVWSMLDYLLGARPDATAHRLEVEPHLPNGWPFVAAKGLKMGDGLYDLTAQEFQEGRSVEVSRPPNEGAAWSVSVVLHGTRRIAAVWVDGRRREGAAGALLRVEGLPLRPGGTLRVVAEYAAPAP